MSKVRIIQKKKKVDSDVADAFAQLAGEGEPDLNIIFTKYNEVRLNTLKCMKEFSTFASQFLTKYPNPDIIAETGKFNQANLDDFLRLMKNRTDQFAGKIDLNVETTAEERQEFAEAYKAIKESDLVKRFIVIRRQIEGFTTIEKISSRSAYIPFSPFINVDLAVLFNEIDTEDKEYICGMLTRLVESAMIVFNRISTPDFDVDQMIAKLMEYIQATKSQIPRAEQAFKKIEESMHILRDNFGSYYRAFASTTDPTVILTNFIEDVRGNVSDKDVKALMQFKKIISFFRTKSTTIKDPRAKAILKAIDDQFNEIEKMCGGKDIGADDLEE